MARTTKTLALNVITTDLDKKKKSRRFINIDPEISDAAIVGIANLVNSFDQDTLEKPTLTRVDEIDIAQ